MKPIQWDMFYETRNSYHFLKCASLNGNNNNWKMPAMKNSFRFNEPPGLKIVTSSSNFTKVKK